MAEKVCRTCHRFVKEGVCPVCKGTSFSWTWKGIVIVSDPKDSTIAKHMGITAPGKYCILMK